MKPPSRAQKIRTFLSKLGPTQGARVASIATAIGEDPVDVGHTLGVMQREDNPLVGRRGTIHKYEYFLLRDVIPQLTPEERRERYNARARARYAPKPRKPIQLKPLVKPTKNNPKPLPRHFRMKAEAGVEQALAKKTEHAHRTEYETIEQFLARGGAVERL